MSDTHIPPPPPAADKASGRHRLVNLSDHAPAGLGATATATAGLLGAGWASFLLGLTAWLIIAVLRDPPATACWFKSLFESVTTVLTSWRTESPKWRKP